MLREIRPAIVMMLAMTVLTGLVYPLAMTGIAQAVFPYQANGSLIVKDKKVIGSALLGQNFEKPEYFHGRPSATTDTDPNDPSKTVPAPYNAGNSSGSNAGPTSKALIERGAGRRRKAQGGKSQHAHPDRPGHHVSKRPGSRHLAGGGDVPGAARGEGPQRR